jgi:hypothetical protein
MAWLILKVAVAIVVVIGIASWFDKPDPPPPPSPPPPPPPSLSFQRPFLTEEEEHESLWAPQSVPQSAPKSPKIKARRQQIAINVLWR